MSSNYDDERGISASIYDSFTLSPLPYPALMLLLLLLVFLGINWHFSADDDSDEEGSIQGQWKCLLFVLPLILLIAIRWSSYLERLSLTDLLFTDHRSPYEREAVQCSQDKTSPWSVAVIFFLVLALVWIRYTLSGDT